MAMTRDKKNNNTKELFACDRRDFLKWSALTGSAMMMLDLDEMHASGVADAIDITKPAPDNAVSASNELLYWIDGPFGTQFGAGYENGLDKIKMAVHVDLPHKSDEFVEGVVVTDDTRKIIAAQRFHPNQATYNGRAPYAIFENINLSYNKDYYVYYVKKIGTDSYVYRYKIDKKNVRNSLLDYSHLPAEARATQIAESFQLDMNGNNNHFFQDRQGKFGEGDGLGQGWVTTCYGHFAPVPTHTVRSKMRFLDPANRTFSVDIGRMHGDSDGAHYMRYFVVTDPVGRVLGGLRRDYDASNTNGEAFYTVTNTLQGGALGGVFKGPLNGNYAPDKLNIADCPYVKIYTEDIRDAIAVITLRLR